MTQVAKSIINKHCQTLKALGNCFGIKAWRLLALALLVQALCSCSGVNNFTAQRPGDVPFRTQLKKEPSMLNLPLEVSTDELARVLNVAVRKELYKGSANSRGIKADVERNGAIAVSAADNYLYLTLPVSLILSYGPLRAPAMPIRLKFKARAEISDDWRLNTEIHYQGISDLLSEEVGIGPFTFKPRSIVEGLTQPLQKIVSDLLSQKINELFPLRPKVAMAWNAAQKPVLLDGNYKAWLKLTPREVLLFQPEARNNRVRMSVGISSFAELLLGSQPIAPAPLPLPRLKQASSFDKTFRVTLNADLPFGDLIAIAKPLLINRNFDSDGNSVLIRDFDLYGNGERLVVKLQTEGDLEGIFYLTARPVFNPQTSVFSVEDVDFDMQTRSMLLQSADWFLHSAIRGMIQEKLNMDLSGQLEQSRQLAAKELNWVQLAEHVFLKGKVKSLKLNDMIVQKDKILIQIISEGEAEACLQ